MPPTSHKTVIALLIGLSVVVPTKALGLQASVPMSQPLHVAGATPPTTIQGDAQSPAPEVGSAAAVVYERTNGTMLYSKNADIPMYPASTTKLMTALLLAERTKPTDILNASERAINVEPSAIYLRPGETITARNVMAALMLQSANDAANVVAEHISGSNEAFATLMNQRARELGATQTNFRNPSGLNDPEHKTTALDLARIASAAVKYPEVRDMMGYRDLYPLGRDVEPKFLANKNVLLDEYPGAYGGKNGWTEDANFTYCGMAQRGELDLVVCVLNNMDKQGVYTDTMKLMDWAFANYARQYLVRPGEVVGTLSVPRGAGSTELVATDSVSVLVPKDRQVPTMKSLHINKDLMAPMSAGAMVGTYELDAGGIKPQVPLKSTTAVSLSPLWVHLSRWKFYAVAGVAALLLLRVCYVGWRRSRRRKRRHEDRRHSPMPPPRQHHGRRSARAYR